MATSVQYFSKVYLYNTVWHERCRCSVGEHRECAQGEPQLCVCSDPGQKGNHRQRGNRRTNSMKTFRRWDEEEGDSSSETGSLDLSVPSLFRARSSL